MADRWKYLQQPNESGLSTTKTETSDRDSSPSGRHAQLTQTSRQSSKGLKTVERFPVELSNHFQILQSREFFIVSNSDEPEASSFTQLLRNGLHSRGFPYSSPEEFRPGLTWQQEATEFIHRSNYILLVLSADFTSSKKCLYMMTVACHRAIQFPGSCVVMPICISKNSPVPPEIAHLVCINYDGDVDGDSVFRPIQQTLANTEEPSQLSLSFTTKANKVRHRKKSLSSLKQLTGEMSQVKDSWSLQKTSSFDRPRPSMPALRQALPHERKRSKIHDHQGHLMLPKDSSDEDSEGRLIFQSDGDGTTSSDGDPRNKERSARRGVFVLFDDRNKRSVRFARDNITPLLDRLGFTARFKKCVEEKAALPQEVTHKSLMGWKKLSEASDSILNDCLGAIVVAPRTNGNLQSELDTIVLHSISSKFDEVDEGFRVLCVRETKHKILPVQLRGAAIADHFKREVKEKWSTVIKCFLNQVLMYRMSPSSNLPEAETSRIEDLPTYSKLDIRRSSVHRLPHRLNRSIFSFLFGILLIIQLFIGITISQSKNSLETLSDVIPNFQNRSWVAPSTFHLVVHVSSRVGMPLVMMIMMRTFTTSVNTSLSITVNHRAILNVWGVIKQLYQPSELAHISTNNTIRWIENRLENAFFNIAFLPAIHSLLLVLGLTLVGTLDYTAYDDWTRTWARVLSVAADFVSLFILLSLTGYVLALQACDLKLVMYGEMLKNCQEGPNEPGYDSHRDAIQKTWETITVFAVVFELILMTMYALTFKESFLVNATSEEHKTLWYTVVSLLIISDMVASCSSATVLRHGSLLLDVSLLFSLVAWKLLKTETGHHLVFREGQLLHRFFFYVLVWRVSLLFTRELGVTICLASGSTEKFRFLSCSNILRTAVVISAIFIVRACFSL